MCADGFGNGWGQGNIAIRGVKSHQGLLLIVDSAKGVGSWTAPIPALCEISPSEAAVLGASLVESLNMNVKIGVSCGQLIPRTHTRSPRLKTAVKHAFSLPVGIVVILTFVLGSELFIAVAVAALIKSVFRAVVKTGNRRGKVEKREGGA